MRKIKIVALWGVLSVALLLGTLGCCSEEADQLAADVNNAGQLMRQIGDSPAVPALARVILELLGLCAAVAVGVYQKVRSSGLQARSSDKSLTLRAVVDAIDALSKAEAQPVKDAIGQTMKARGIASVADQVVDEHRSKLA